MKKLIPGMAIAACFLAACTGKTSVTVGTTDSTATYLKKITQVAMSSDSAMIKKDVAGSMKDLAANYAEYGSSSKPVTNKDSIKTGMTTFLDAFPDFKGDNLHATAADSTVVIIGHWTGTFKKEYMKIKPTNKSFDIWDADIYTFNKEAKITSHRNIQSGTTFLTQLGVPIPPAKK